MESESSTRFHTRLPPVCILSQINPAHALHSTSRSPVLIFYSHLLLSLTSVLFPLGHPTKPSMQLFCLHKP
jgi:hypothetical protein